MAQLTLFKLNIIEDKDACRRKTYNIKPLPNLKSWDKNTLFKLENREGQVLIEHAHWKII